MQIIEQFIQHLTDSGKSYSTIIAYRKDLLQLDEYLDTDLSDAQGHQIVEALQRMREAENFSDKTISRKINSYRTFYRYLQALGMSIDNPALILEHPKLDNKPPRVLSPMEYLALREISRDNKRLYGMIELMLQTGLRIGELSRLQVQDVILQGTNPRLKVAAFSTNPAREVPLNAKAISLLEQHLSKADAEPSRALFSTRDGKPIIIRNIRSAIDRAMQKVGIKDASVNDLRNTFIVEQMKAGVALDFIQEVVGHRSKTATMKYLSHLDGKYKSTGDSKLIAI